MTDDPIDTLLVDVRASTQGFAADIMTMRRSVDSALVDGFAAAGTVLERGLLTALRRGSLGFDDLRRVALRAMDDIATQAVQGGLGALFGPQASGQTPGSAAASPLASLFSGAIGAVLGLPGRATGGPVAPGRGYLVGERGPELFVPTTAGRVEPGPATAGSGPRDIRVAIQLNTPRGSSAPQALQRSSRQMASAIRRAMGA